MELGQLLQETLKIFQASNLEELNDKLFDISINNKYEYHEKFKKLIEDLSVDWLQKIYQYYQADREGKKQDFTPPTLAKFASSLAMTKDSNSILDLCAGSGAMTIQAWNVNKELEFTCVEIDQTVIPYLLFNLSLRNIQGYVINQDVLSGELYKIYKLEKGMEFSKITIAENEIMMKCDSVISNPPYNMAWMHPLFAQMQPRFSHCEMPPTSNANYAFALTAIEITKNKATMIMPIGFLNTQNKSEKEIREYLIMNNLIESVILCPDRMFESTSIPTCLITFSKIKKNDFIQFIDMREVYDIEIREQNGQFGSTAHTTRVYKKEIRVFNDEQITEAIGTININNSIPGYCASVPKEEVIKKEYYLSPSIYIDSKPEENNSRKPEDIVQDINKIIKDKNILKLTLNETVAREIGLAEVYEALKQSNECNKILKNSLGLDIASGSYIQLTKNKNEFKFENTSKEEISSVLLTIFNTWKHHIYYLNNKENIYLAELRDALLPGLMSGEIKVGDI